MKVIRILKNNIRDAFKSVFRNFSLSTASITCTTITLILVSIAMIISYNINSFTKDLESELNIVVYLNEDTTQEQMDAIKSQIEAIENVKKDNVTPKSKEDWKLELQQESESLEKTLNYLTTNPLLNSFIVKVDDVDDFSSTALKIKEIEGVKDAKYGEGMVEQFVSIFNIIEKTTYIIVIALILVTAFLIRNTIKLTIFSRRTEIEIMRLVGTSNTVIKLPFLFEGFILGVIGSIIPVMVTIYGYILLYDHMGGYIFSHLIKLVEPMNFVLYVSGILVIIGAGVGMIGSYNAVRKYLKI